MTEHSVMLAAGGTGGHLFPAFALAEELGRRGHAVDLVTDMRGDRYGTGFPARAVHQVAAATLAGRSPGAMAKTALTLGKGLKEALALLGRVKPAAIVGFGGYPTLPPLVAAWLRRVPSIIHEQNAVLGRANKLLSRRVTAIATSFEGTRFVEGAAVAKARLTGNPVRSLVIDWSQRAYLPPPTGGPYHLLVFGGSQGARYFSDAVPPALALLPEPVRQRLFVVQQAREEDLARVEAGYERMGVRAHVASFFQNLPEEMARAHLVIARAGASSVAELAVMGRPSILVPLPHALDNDQLLNAKRLAESGGSWCIEQSTLTPERLAETIGGLLSDGDSLARAAQAARTQGRPDAVLRLADLVEEIMGARAPAASRKAAAVR